MPPIQRFKDKSFGWAFWLVAALRGKSERQPAIDVALIAPEPLGPDVRRPQSLPVRLRRWIPVIGEYVLAVGFPQLDLSELNVQKQTALLTEGMQGAYGRIVAIHPDGVSTTNSTPCSRWKEIGLEE